MLLNALFPTNILRQIFSYEEVQKILITGFMFLVCWEEVLIYLSSLQDDKHL